MDSIGPWGGAETDVAVRSVKSAERTLALFELFSLYQRPLSVGQMSKLLDIPQPSVTMLVRNLVRLGYIEHDRASRTYIPTIRIMLLGSWIHRRFSHDHNLEGHLDDLLRKVGETVLLGIQNSIFSQYVSAQMPEHPDRMETQSGMLRPITCTAVGRVLLSLKSDREIEMLVRRCNAEVGEERLRVNPSEFMKLMERIRTQGYAETCGDMREGFGAFAVAIPAPVGQIPMAIGIGATSENAAAKRELIVESLLEVKGRLVLRTPATEDSLAA